MDSLPDLPPPASTYQPGTMLVARCQDCQTTQTASGAGVTALAGVFASECREKGHAVTVELAPLASGGDARLAAIRAALGELDGGRIDEHQAIGRIEREAGL